ncbi:hypothetical protein F5Y13DRAFT_114612 [Hypoxylon sp. FL1857]|nr:hypothetical protein F5Y13DRAFT_114612 [Hypoxylon sp. FL1857]
MTEDHFDPIVVGLVRRYSDRLANTMPDNQLERAVGIHEEELQADEYRPTAWNHWLRFDTLESDAVLAGLQVEAKEAAELWRKLKLDNEGLGLGGDHIPTIETLWTAVHQAQIRWDEKNGKGFGRAKAHFSSFLETMEAHKYLFSIIPNGEKYTSLITGVITSIVKASVNHDSITEGFSRALQEISRDLNFVRRGTRICDTAEMRGHIVLLYREVFAFLCYTMKWFSSSWNRFKKAFDNRFYDKNVQQRVSRVQSLVQRVRDEINLMSEQTVHNIHLDQRVGFVETYNRIDTRIDRLQTDLDEKFMGLTRMIGEQMSQTLMANAQHELSNLKPRDLLMDKTDDNSSSIKIARIPTQATAVMEREDLEQLKRVLARFAEDGKGDSSGGSMGADLPLIPNEVAVDLQRWAQSRGSSLLWVEGPAYGPFDETLPSIGTRIWAISEELDLPCIGFFAKTKYAFESQTTSMKDAGIIAMLYSLNMQLADIVPATFEPVEALADLNLQRLDGTTRSIRTALGVLRALLSIIDPGIVCVICGFELVDCREHLSALVETIQLLGGQPAERRLKVLFLSSGNCRALSNATRLEQRSDATRMVLSRGRSPLAGGVAANDIRFR